MTDTEEQAVIDSLLAVEQEMAGKLGQLHADHVELQKISYDTDARALRPWLDKWFEWQLWAGYWLTQAKIARWEAKQDLDRAWERAHTSTRDIDFAAAGFMHYGSQPEREVYYKTRTRKQGDALDLLNRLVDVTYDFQRVLKSAYDHWDKRRVDTKYELDRMSRVPGSDYQS